MAAWEALAAAALAAAAATVGLAATAVATGAEAERAETAEAAGVAAAPEANMATAGPTVGRVARAGVRGGAAELDPRVGRNRRSPCRTCKSRTLAAAHLCQARHRRTSRRKRSLGSADSCSGRRCPTNFPGRCCRLGSLALGSGLAGVAWTGARCRLRSGSAGDLHRSPRRRSRSQSSQCRVHTGCTGSLVHRRHSCRRLRRCTCCRT